MARRDQRASHRDARPCGCPHRRRTPEARFSLPEATYLAWIDLCAYGLGDDPAEVLLDEARVALSSGNDFGEHGVGFVRLNFATTQPILDEILNRIVERLGR